MNFVGGANPFHPVPLPRPAGTTDQALELNAWLEFQDLQSSMAVNAAVYRGHPDGGVYSPVNNHVFGDKGCRVDDQLFDSSKPGYGQIPSTPEFFPPPFPPIDPACLKIGDAVGTDLFPWMLMIPAKDIRAESRVSGGERMVSLTVNVSGANAFRKFAAAHKAEILATLYGSGTLKDYEPTVVNNNVEPAVQYAAGMYHIKQSVGGVSIEVHAATAWEAQEMFNKMTQEPGYSPGDKLVDTSEGIQIPPPNSEGNNLEAIEEALKGQEPDAFCVTTADGGCVSDDPRCMHNRHGNTVTIEEALKGQDVTYDQHSCPEGYAAKVLETVRNRGSDYGTPAENHQLTADLLTSFFTRKSGLPITISAEDVCLINILQKVARLAHHSKDDNYLDIAGYAENVAMLRKDQRKRG